MASSAATRLWNKLKGKGKGNGKGPLANGGPDPPLPNFAEPWQPAPTLSPSTTAVANCIFFQRLSVELQQKILAYAIGGRIVHLELVVRDCTWHWQGFICGRSILRIENRGMVGPVEDDCLLGTDCVYGVERRGDDPRKLCVGAMGWLMSCRQAYLAGIAILYAENTFHIADTTASLQLGGLLPPQQLLSITRVEMLWEVEDVQRGVKSTFHSLLDTLPKVLPNLRDVFISFQCNLLSPTLYRNPADILGAMELLILPPMDEMVRKMLPSVREVTIALPSPLWFEILGRAHVAGATIEPENPRFGNRCWRPLKPAQWSDGQSCPGYWLIAGICVNH